MKELGMVAQCFNKACQLQRLVLHGSQSLTARSFSSRQRSVDDQILVGKADENTFVCWHPEQSFPYEHTKPLPRKAAELQQGDSVLKVQHISDYEGRYRPDGPLKEELEELFFTTKHEWRARPRENKYKNLDPPKDREGI